MQKTQHGQKHSADTLGHHSICFLPDISWPPSFIPSSSRASLFPTFSSPTTKLDRNRTCLCFWGRPSIKAPQYIKSGSAVSTYAQLLGYSKWGRCWTQLWAPRSSLAYGATAAPGGQGGKSYISAPCRAQFLGKSGLVVVVAVVVVAVAVIVVIIITIIVVVKFLVTTPGSIQGQAWGTR